MSIFLGIINEQVITINCRILSFIHILDIFDIFANEIIMDLQGNLKRKLSKATSMQMRRKEAIGNKNYAGIIEKLKNWLLENYPEAVDE